MKPKFKRLRKLVKALKSVPNDDFDMDRIWSDDAPRCAAAHVRTLPQFAKQVKKYHIDENSGYTDIARSVFKLKLSDADLLFGGVGGSDYDKPKANDSEGKVGKKVFKRRVKKFFKEHGRVL